MPIFIVCQNKENQRVALIQEDQIDASEWEALGQQIEADNWLSAREKVDTSEMYEDEPRGWYFYD